MKYYDFFNSKDIEKSSASLFHEHHGDDIEKFKEEYNSYLGIEDFKIIRADNPRRLKIGFCAKHKKYNVTTWHTVNMLPFSKDRLSSERRERKALDTYTPLYVSVRNQEGYFYLRDGVNLSMTEYKEARKKWLEADDDKTFYEFLEEIKDKSWQTQKKLD